ncbi:MAG: STAS domain-containing protein [Phycisphaeraceae bacterium]|nr:STAS domain-containing protein [Phycisphaeraceae bacterium]
MPLTEWSDEILLVELAEEPIFSEEMGNLASRLEHGEARHVVLDLRNVITLNSSNLAQLLRLRKKVLSLGKRLRLCGVRDTVWSVLLVTGLDKVFDFNEDVTAALASMQMSL